MEPGGLWWTNVLNSALLPQRLRPHTRLEHQDPVSHMASVFSSSWTLHAGLEHYKHISHRDHWHFVRNTQTPSLRPASVGGSPAEVGGGFGSVRGQGH